MIRYGEFITPEEYMELRKMVGWVEFPIEQARACIDKAYMILCARDNEKAIGVVRLLWDGGYIAFLSDVIVDPEYQGQGIGKKLVDSCISRSISAADASASLMLDSRSLTLSIITISGL